MEKDSPAVFIVGAALTAALVAAILSIVGFELASTAGATGFAVALWLIAWIYSRREKPMP
jgi:hypothetical protein